MTGGKTIVRATPASQFGRRPALRLTGPWEPEARTVRVRQHVRCASQLGSWAGLKGLPSAFVGRHLMLPAYCGFSRRRNGEGLGKPPRP